LADALDSALLARLRAIVAGDGATESELRELAERADGWARSLQAQIGAGERRLARLTADPAGSMVEIAAELRRVERLRPRLADMRELLEGLDARARELRTAWLRSAADC
jgi:hypothetical protein